MTRFYIRSASDKTDDWPFWFVADDYQSGLNVTARLQSLRGDKPVNLDGEGLFGKSFALLPLLSDYDALKLCRWANSTLGTATTGLWQKKAAAA